DVLPVERDGVLIGIDGRVDVAVLFEIQRVVEPILGSSRRVGTLAGLRPELSFDHAQHAVFDRHIEPEHVLAAVDLVLTIAVAHDHLVADSADAEPLQLHGLCETLAQVFERAADAPSRDLRLDERARRAQHDQILKLETILAARAARRRDEADVDETSNGAARQMQDSFDVPHAVRLHRAPRRALPTTDFACGLRRLLDAFGLFARTELGGGVFRRLGALQAGAQRLHQVDDLAGALGFDLSHGNLLSFDFLLDFGLDA